MVGLSHWLLVAKDNASLPLATTSHLGASNFLHIHLLHASCHYYLLCKPKEHHHHLMCKLKTNIVTFCYVTKSQSPPTMNEENFMGRVISRTNFVNAKGF